ncbi:serine/threonine-protein kinase prpf4B isoform X2 [Drosophila takahashii]|uniref:serine/threonine-protein kinase prpf4B isoform X2 n=1 Tax=Drosophila takahashii TaxID=29030 RepID=UPI001CF8AE1C|nr:serine/threonine-protein kinase prpf4B isoform X2 [Drosophila takahashii]
MKSKSRMSPVGANNLYDEPEVMEEFISCYRHFTALWDSSSPDYLSKQKKEPGYQELLKILRRVNGGCSVQDVKRKINSLRCCYRREIKKVQASLNGYQPRLWWFHLMDFLKPVLNIQSPVRVKSESMDDSLDETSIHDDDMFSEPFHTEEDVLRLEAVGDGEAEPEPELEPEHDQDPETEAEHKVDDYQGNIKNNPYANNPSSSIATDKTNRRIRIRRRRSSNDTDYGETGRKRRVEEIPDRDRDRDRERERDRDRGRDRERESESENECELIGRRMATHFRHMRPDQRLYAERIISEVLVYGRMNRLSFEARFLPGPK